MVILPLIRNRLCKSGIGKSNCLRLRSVRTAEIPGTWGVSIRPCASGAHKPLLPLHLCFQPRTRTSRMAQPLPGMKPRADQALSFNMKLISHHELQGFGGIGEGMG